MDNLVRKSDAERASLFLRAFFPSERRLFNHLDASRTRMKSLFTKLPASIQQMPPGTEDPSRLVRQRLSWTTTPVDKWTAETVQSVLVVCLPVSIEHLDLLAHRPAVGDAVREVKELPKNVESFEGALKKVDAVLEEFSPGAKEMTPHLDTALAVFAEFNQWTAVRERKHGESFVIELNKWLELRALADLTDKQFKVVATLAAAQRAGWHPTTAAPAFAQASIESARPRGASRPARQAHDRMRRGEDVRPPMGERQDGRQCCSDCRRGSRPPAPDASSQQRKGKPEPRRPVASRRPRQRHDQTR